MEGKCAECLMGCERRLLSDPKASLKDIRETVLASSAKAMALAIDAGLSTADQCRVVVPRNVVRNEQK